MKSPLDPVLNLPGVTVAGRSRLRGFYLFSICAAKVLGVACVSFKDFHGYGNALGITQ
jgi:hypothetical protein